MKKFCNLGSWSSHDAHLKWRLETYNTVMTLSFRTDKSVQIVQTQIRLLLEELSDQGLHYLLFHLHLFDEIPEDLASSSEF